jgi:ribose transport system permease protein
VAGKIDLSVGSIYALSGVTMAMTLRALGPLDPAASIGLGLAISLGIGALSGLLNGLMTVSLGVHPFIITLGTMWALRGVAFVISRAESILVPDALTRFAKATFGLSAGLYPVPLAVMIVVTLFGAIYLSRTVMGRHIYAVGGNTEASRYSGLAIERIVIGVYAISGLTAGIAAFMGSAYYGSAASADATGYELYVIASAVVGGASLSGGKGGAVSAALGALLIVLIRQSIVTLRLDQNYEWIIIGCAIVAAVALERVNARLAAKRLAERR